MLKGSEQSDFIAAIFDRDVWMFHAYLDIRLRYRRSTIGPFWITLSMAIFITALGVVYTKLFNVDTKEYLPFLAVGFVIWNLISGLICEFPNIFVENGSYIKDTKINPYIILLRLVARHIIIFLHNTIIIFGIYIYFGIVPSWSTLLAIPGLVLVVFNLLALGVSISLIGVRFRDVAPIIQNIVQVAFFITPLTWLPRLLPEDSWIMLANPFYYFLDITRAPLIGIVPSPDSWVVTVTTLVVMSTFSSIVYKYQSGNIPHWV